MKGGEIIMSSTKRKYTREFKIQVVQEVESGVKTKAQATREHEISEGLISKWVYAYRENPQTAFTKQHSFSNPEDKLKSRIRELEWVLGKKTLEAEILKTTLEELKVKKGGYMG